MKSVDEIGSEQVDALYTGPEVDLWELLMGQQIHVGGLRSTLELADRAGLAAGTTGVDLCCCSGAGMRALVRMRGVASMVGVDANARMIERGRARCAEEGVADRVRFVCADVTASGLPSASADFAFGEDAWCYVADKAKLVAEAARLVRSGGTIAFTDWIEGNGLSEADAGQYLRIMRFPSVLSVADYRRLLEQNGLGVVAAEDTGRFAPALELYQRMIEEQLEYDALRIVGFARERLDLVLKSLVFLRDLGRAGRVGQGRFVARRA